MRNQEELNEAENVKKKLSMQDTGLFKEVMTDGMLF